MNKEDTLDAAQNDAEHLVVEKMHKKADYVRKLEHLFQAIDSSGSGLITEERLTQILGNPKVETSVFKQSAFRLDTTDHFWSQCTCIRNLFHSSNMPVKVLHALRQNSGYRIVLAILYVFVL